MAKALIKRKKSLVKRKAKKAEPVNYRDGAEGFISWCEDFVHIPIYPVGSTVAKYVRMGEMPKDINPETGRSYKSIWEGQKEIAREALRMEDGLFVYTLIVLCWMRGEGKSLLVVLIQLWRFFCWPKMTIVLGANSKDQIRFVHFDIMLDIILHSPDLLDQVGGEKGVKQKEIIIKQGKKVISLIKPISSFTGIMSNITGYTFSEMFAMKNPTFFTQLDGSTRNVPNALGIIDSTVSDKQHVLYGLYYNANVAMKTKRVFFSYRCSKSTDADPDDFWHPHMTRAQLDDYKAKFPFGEFDRYFRNVWEAGQLQVFSDEIIDEIYVAGVYNGMLNHKDVSMLLNQRSETVAAISDMASKGLVDDVLHLNKKVDEITSKLKPMSDLYKLTDASGRAEMASLDDLLKLGDIFDTDWAVLAGSDFGDPYALRGLARTIVVIIAKGLAGSRSDPNLYLRLAAETPYLYVILGVYHVEDHSLNRVKSILDAADDEYAGLDTYCSERYGNWDVQEWCDDRGIKFTPIFASYDRQKEAFKAMHEILSNGLLKSAPIPVSGSKREDILREEIGVFMHDPEKRWFGSPEKMDKYGIQDDCMFGLGWGLYGGRELTATDFRIRKSMLNFGFATQNSALLGKYS